MGFRELCTPDLRVDTVYHIDLQQLKQNGIRGFVFDIDNTLAAYEETAAGEELSIWLSQLSQKGFAAVLVSNNNRRRVENFASSVRLPWYARALKPCKFYLKKACRLLGLLPENIALVGDQVFTDVLGGNRMKMFTVLVSPISDKDTKFVKWKRKWERRIMKSE